MTYKIQSSEVIGFAQGVLAVAILFVDREELRGNYLSAVLVIHTVSKCIAYKITAKIHTRHRKQSKWNVPPSARTNWPVSGSPHFLHILSCPDAVLPFLVRDRFRSPLVFGSPSLSFPLALPEGDAVSRVSGPNAPGMGSGASCISMSLLD
jgi:hypothetical protein